MKSLTLVLFWVAIASCLFAQKEVTVKESTAQEKTVSVNVTKSDDGKRTVKIITDDGSGDQVIEWTDNGEIPADVKKQLEAQGIDLKMLDGSGGERHVIVKVDGDDGDRKKRVKKDIKVIKKDGDGATMEYEWDGEGEMPAEMKELMEEHDIEIDMDDLHEGHGKGEKRKAKMRVLKDERKKMRHREMRKGQKVKANEQSKYKIVTIDEEGNKEVKEWVGDEGPHKMHEKDGNVFIMKGGRGDGHARGGNDFVFYGDDDDKTMSDAYMGAQIESADNGARILEIMKDSPADKAGLVKGDIVTRVNGARARDMEGLLDILGFYDPNDKVELTVVRDGKERKLNLTLGQRPDSFR